MIYNSSWLRDRDLSTDFTHAELQSSLYFVEEIMAVPKVGPCSDLSHERTQTPNRQSGLCAVCDKIAAIIILVPCSTSPRKHSVLVVA